MLLELNCETDFVAKTPAFKDLAKNIAMQIAASRPEYVQREDIPGGRFWKTKGQFCVPKL